MNLEKALNHSIFKTIAKVAGQKNQPVYVVGGFVRDYFLNRNQKKDLDFVTVGSGIELAQAVAKELNPNIKVNIFKRFGTAMFRYNDLDLEFVGARKESYDKNSRKPSVENGTLEDDQLRRDFTINALAISLNKEDYGQLIDPFGGIHDLLQKTIKTPQNPDITYSDDPLRMMRAVRFATQLDFKIESESFDAIRRNADRIKIVSMERITVELQKIMHCPKPSVGLKLLDDLGLLHFILPELTALKGIEEIEGQTHKDNFYHTLEVVDNLSVNSDKIWLRWAALLHDVGKARTKRFDKRVGWTFHSHEFVGAKMVPKIFRRLKLPMGDPMKYVYKLVRLSSRPIALVEEETTDSALRRLLFEVGDDFEDLITLCKADITTKNPYKQKKYKQNFTVVEEKMKELEERDRIRNFQPPVSGEEIMQTFNLKPCREIGLIKNAIKEAILDGIIPNEYEAAKAFMICYGKELLEDKKQL